MIIKHGNLYWNFENCYFSIIAQTQTYPRKDKFDGMLCMSFKLCATEH